MFCEGGASLSPQALALAIKGFPLASKSASTPPPRLAPSAQEKCGWECGSATWSACSWRWWSPGLVALRLENRRFLARIERARASLRSEASASHPETLPQLPRREKLRVDGRSDVEELRA